MYLHEYEQHLPKRREALAQEITLAASSAGREHSAGLWLELTDTVGGPALREAFEALLGVQRLLRHPKKDDQLPELLMMIRDVSPPDTWTSLERKRQALMAEIARRELQVVDPTL